MHQNTEFRLPFRRAGKLLKGCWHSDATIQFCALVMMRPHLHAMGGQGLARYLRRAIPAAAMPNNVIEPGSGAGVASRLEEYRKCSIW